MRSKLIKTPQLVIRLVIRIQLLGLESKLICFSQVIVSAASVLGETVLNCCFFLLFCFFMDNRPINKNTTTEMADAKA